MFISKNFSSNSSFMLNPLLGKSHSNGLIRINELLRRIFSGLGRRSAVGGALEHVGSLPLTAHASLALVRMREEMLLLGITAHGITLLSKIPDADVPRPSVTPQPLDAKVSKGEDHAR